jgi:hypothetical protein
VWNEYAREKLREIDEELQRGLRGKHVARAAPERPHVLAPAARIAGRRLRHLGEAIESWATPCAELHRSPDSSR